MRPGLESVLVQSAPSGEFVPDQSVLQNLKELRLLVVGAGGLGCEIVKNLALSGFARLDIIDMDTVELTNLNRQFLFRASDVGKPKATVAAKAVMRMVPNVEVVPHVGRIQDMSDDFYKSFQLVVCGLDSVSARRWINAKLVSLVDEGDPRSLRPLIDGGTEGFMGQARVILPTMNACYECSLEMLPKQVTYPLCTIAATPRLPEHCIAYASVVLWPQKFARPLDPDSQEDMQFVVEEAGLRAASHGIQGVTLELAQGVVKNIIPAIASTNAIIAAGCCNEALKLATSAAPFLDNYMMYSGLVGAYTHTFALERKPNCPVCGNLTHDLTADRDTLLEEFMSDLKENPALGVNSPSLSVAGELLYAQAPESLRLATRENLTKPLGELLSSGDEIAVTDKDLPFSLRLRVFWSDHPDPNLAQPNHPH